MICLVRAFSQVLDKPLDELIKGLGHDGSEEIWPGFTRGFHIQEFVHLCYKYGYTLTPFEWETIQAPRETCEPYHQDFSEKVRPILKTTKGVIIGYSTQTGVGHAVASFHGKVYNSSWHKYKPDTYWMVSK